MSILDAAFGMSISAGLAWISQGRFCFWKEGKTCSASTKVSLQLSFKAEGRSQAAPGSAHFLNSFNSQPTGCWSWSILGPCLLLSLTLVDLQSGAQLYPQSVESGETCFQTLWEMEYIVKQNMCMSPPQKATALYFPRVSHPRALPSCVFGPLLRFGSYLQSSTELKPSKFHPSY